jgi:hypothetical protein
MPFAQDPYNSRRINLKSRKTTETQQKNKNPRLSEKFDINITDGPKNQKK